MIVAVGGKSNKVGKTLFCKYLFGFLGKSKWQYLSTSEALVQELSLKLKISVSEIKKNKDRYRPHLIDLTKGNPTHAVMSALLDWDQGKHLLIESVRRREEFGFFERDKNTIFIYVTCPDAVLLQRGSVLNDLNEVDDLFMPYGEPARNVYLVNNNGSQDALKRRAKELAEMILSLAEAKA